MEGLTMVQASERQRVTRELWVLLDQDQYNKNHADIQRCGRPKNRTLDEDGK